LNELRGRGGRATSFQWRSDGGPAALWFGSPRADGARQRRPSGRQRLEREVGDDPGDGPNGPVQPNGPAWQLGWLSVFGPKSRI
jgi:hypothetical protein